MKKIGVLRANALGDVIITTPSFWALKKAFPQAELVLLGRRLHQELFLDRESPVDRVIPLPDSLQFDRPILWNSENLDVLRKLQNENFDLIIGLHGGGRHSNSFINRIKPAISLGAKTPEAEELSYSCPYNLYQHEVTRHAGILRCLGIRSEIICPELSSTDADYETGKSFLSKLSIHKKFILLNPGANDPRRRWPLENFAEVSQMLKNLGYEVVVNIGPDEGDLGRRFKTLAPFSHIVSPTLNELIGIIHLAEFVISNDTGTMHLGLAFKKPTIALFWFRNLIGYAPLDSVHARTLVSWNTQCSVCGSNCSEEPCAHTESLIGDITTKAVYQAMEDYIQRRSHGGENRSRSFDRGITGQDFNS